MEEAVKASANVCEPIDILPRLKQHASFALVPSIDDLPEPERILFNCYQIGGGTQRGKIAPTALRKEWVQACVDATDQEFWGFGMQLPCIRMGKGALTSALKPTCWDPSSSVKARLSFDFDCIERGDREFPTAQQIFDVACEFLNEHIVTKDAQSGEDLFVMFEQEPATLLLGSGVRKWISVHLIFHRLSQPQSLVHFERARKKGPIHKKFCDALKPLGLEADLCLTGLRWEFTDKQDPVTVKDQGDILPDDIKGKKNTVHRWRRAVLPIAQRFNVESTDLASFAELADELDPHVLVHDDAWHREAHWIDIPMPEAPQRHQSLNLSQSVGEIEMSQFVSMPAAAQWNVELVTSKLWELFPQLYPDPKPEVKTKVFGENKLMVLPQSDVCPLKKEPSSDMPAHKHSSDGKFYVVAHADGVLSGHCHVCSSKVVLVAARDPVREDVLREFDEDFVRVAQYVYMKAKVDPHKLEYERPSAMLSKEAFLNHARTLDKERGKPRIKVGKEKQRRAVYWFINSVYMYDRIAYVPEADLGSRIYNTWTGFNFGVVMQAEQFKDLPVEELMDRWAVTRQHILRNCCNNDEQLFRRFIGFFADMVTNPGRKPKWGIVLWGPQGAGKGLVIQFFAKLVGKLNFIHADNRSLTAHFNAQIMSKLLVYADEGIDNENRGALNYIKKLLTEEEQTFREKNIAESQIDTCFRVCASVNSEPDWVEGGDRRWQVHSVPGTSDLPIARMVEERESLDGPAAFYVLAKRGLFQEGFNPFECVSTSNKWEMLAARFTPVQRYWYMVLRGDIDVCANFETPGSTWQRLGHFVPPALRPVEKVGVDVLTQRALVIRELGRHVFEYPDCYFPKELFYVGFLQTCSAAESARVKDSAFWVQTSAIFGAEFERKQRSNGNRGKVYVVKLMPLDRLRVKFAQNMRAPADIWAQADRMDESE